MNEKDSSASNVQPQSCFKEARGIPGQTANESTEISTPATRRFVVSSKSDTATVRFIPRKSDNAPRSDSTT